MKKPSVIFLLFAVAALSVVSCVEYVVPTYSGTNSIYFLGREPIINFSHSPDRKDSLINIRLQVLGRPADRPRTYRVQVIDSVSTAIEGIHFDYFEEDFTVAAGALSDTLRIKLKKVPVMDTDTLTVVFGLLPNEHFHFRTDNQSLTSSFVVRSTNVLAPPTGWVTLWLGTFSGKKLFLMAEVFDFDPAIFNEPLSFPTLRGYAINMQRWLNDEDAAGRTVYEEDGTPMVMGPNAQ